MVLNMQHFSAKRQSRLQRDKVAACHAEGVVCLYGLIGISLQSTTYGAHFAGIIRQAVLSVPANTCLLCLVTV